MIVRQRSDNLATSVYVIIYVMLCNILLVAGQPPQREGLHAIILFFWVRALVIVVIHKLWIGRGVAVDHLKNEI